MNKVIKGYTYDEFGMYANGEPVRPIVCLLLLGLLRVPISVILLVGCVFLPGGIILMLAANTSTNGAADRNHQTAITDGTSH